MELAKLREPMPFLWKVQAFTPKAEEKTGCICVGYIDARDVADKLDAVVGPENWQCRYSQNKNNLFCSIGIRTGDDVNEKAWVWKEDCGTESDMEAEKGEASDAFKRAAVKWGVGRFLYDLPEMKLKVVKNGKSYMPADGSGQALWGKEKLTEFCNSQIKKPKKTEETPKPQPAQKVKAALPEQSTSKASLPTMSPEEKTRMSRIYNFVRDNLANGQKIEPKDLAAVVYAALGHWPQNPGDEELIVNNLKIEPIKGLTCESDGKPQSGQAA